MNRAARPASSSGSSPAPPASLAPWLFVCVAAIVYVTLYPWTGWRTPGVPLLAFVSEPWPRYWTRLDVWMNFVAYLPLGLLGTVWLARRLSLRTAALVAATAASLLSGGLEALQTLLPARIPSLLDMLANASGAALGALLVATLGPRRVWRRLRALGHWSPLAPGSGLGLLLLAVWLAVQWHPQLIVFASGELAPALATLTAGSEDWLARHRLPLDYQPLAEAGAVAATTLGIGLLTRELLRRTSGLAIAAPILLAAAVKSSATANLLGARNALAWLSAGAQGGLLVGVLLLALSAWWRPRWRMVAAMLALSCATALNNLAPPNVYFDFTLAAWDQGGWANVNGLLRALALVWPFAAIAWCAARLYRLLRFPRPPRSAHPIIAR
jgi:VanZ family protein